MGVGTGSFIRRWACYPFWKGLVKTNEKPTASLTPFLLLNESQKITELKSSILPSQEPYYTEIWLYLPIYFFARNTNVPFSPQH